MVNYWLPKLYICTILHLLFEQYGSIVNSLVLYSFNFIYILKLIMVDDE